MAAVNKRKRDVEKDEFHLTVWNLEQEIKWMRDVVGAVGPTLEALWSGLVDEGLYESLESAYIRYMEATTPLE